MAKEHMESAKSLVTNKNTNIGIFLVLSGLILVVINFSPENSLVSVLLQQWWLVLTGIYLVILALLNHIHKKYIIAGLFLIALWIGQVISNFFEGWQKYLWPSLLLLLGIGLVIYGFITREKSETLSKYIIIGGILAFFSLNSLLSILYLEDLQTYLKKLWPIIIILLGISYIKWSSLERKNKNMEKAEAARKDP